MGRARLHLPAPRWAVVVALADPERHYLVEVLRLGPGAPVEIFDGQGRSGPAVLDRAGEAWVLRPTTPPVAAEGGAAAGPTVSLGLALTKGKKLDLVIRMVTEIGVGAILPFTCERAVPRPEEDRALGRLGRWQAIAREAARQSGRATLPVIEPIRRFEEILPQREQSLRLLFHETAACTDLATLLRDHPGRERFLLVGPEGGFSEPEVERAALAGFAPVRLALPVLRAETAAVVAAALACLPDCRP